MAPASYITSLSLYTNSEHSRTGERSGRRPSGSARVVSGSRGRTDALGYPLIYRLDSPPPCWLPEQVVINDPRPGELGDWQNSVVLGVFLGGKSAGAFLVAR